MVNLLGLLGVAPLAACCLLAVALVAIPLGQLAAELVALGRRAPVPNLTGEWLPPTWDPAATLPIERHPWEIEADRWIATWEAKQR